MLVVLALQSIGFKKYISTIRYKSSTSIATNHGQWPRCQHGSCIALVVVMAVVSWLCDVVVVVAVASWLCDVAVVTAVTSWLGDIVVVMWHSGGCSSHIVVM